MSKDRILNILDITDENFVHLHVHDRYSLLDGYGSAKQHVSRAKELGMTALATTNHNHLGGVIEFQKECIEQGIKPILGLETYWTWDTNILSLPKEDRDKLAEEKALADGVVIPKKIKKSDMTELLKPYSYDTKQYHLLLIAINQTGWQNLVRLQSEAATKCTFNGRYICDDEMLEKYNEGLIASTACISNVIPHLIQKGLMREAEEQLDKWRRIFGDRLYLEIQPLNIGKQRIVNLQYAQWAEEKNIKLIATNDVHYTRFEDHDDHDTLLCIGTGKKKEETERMRYSNDFWIKSYKEMIDTFSIQALSMQEEFDDLFDYDDYMDKVKDALSNTNLIASMIQDIKLGSDVNLFPKLEIPYGLSSEKYLTLECFKRLYKYKKTNPEINLNIYERRLNEELNIINTKGFAPYVLVVQDYIEWANANGCPTGPGRGSGAGSLVLFLMGITRIIDPIKYNLLFFRFLTMDRSAPPDVDTDFEYYGRDSVIAYLEEKYGKEQVAHIGTYTELGVRNGFKDVGRVLDMDFGVINNLNKKVEQWSDRTDLKFKHLDALKDSDRESEKIAYIDFKQHEEQYPELFRLARLFEGTPRNTGVHASGILITPTRVNDLFPTRKATDGTIITLYTGPQLEDLKAIKFDILGLKTLSVIKNTLKSINEELTMEDLYDEIDINDPEIFSMIKDKQTEGLFQIESNLFKGMMDNIKPDTMNDIVAITALGRPGPLSAGMDKSYAARKNGDEEAVEPLPNTWEIVKDTYGTICYQEQIMLIAKVVAGFNDNQADSYLRKAFAKKKKDKMELCRQWFIYGKKNTEAPSGYDSNNKNQTYYDPSSKHGPEIIGGINNGYTETELIKFWTNIEGFADYLFNKSHAACYSFITVLTGYLKKYHPVEFMASLLSVQEKKEKIDLYSKVCRKMNITIKAPDINLSGKDFTPVDKNILYGLRSIKGVGESAIPAIIENRPYTNIEDAIRKVEKKSFNKRVGMALIKAGAFDFCDSNRNKVINLFYDARKDKDDRLDEDYREEDCIEYEQEVLGTPITFLPWWDNISAGDKATVTLKLEKVFEKTDKNGNMMGFISGTSEGCLINAIVFSRTYCANADKFDKTRNEYVVLQGKKDEKGTLIVSKVMTLKEAQVKKPISRKATFLEDNDLNERFEGVI